VLGEPNKAEEHLAALKEICLIPCNELADLERAITARMVKIERHHHSAGPPSTVESKVFVHAENALFRSLPERHGCTEPARLDAFCSKIVIEQLKHDGVPVVGVVPTLQTEFGIRVAANLCKR
jgi:hypothetical protein